MTGPVPPTPPPGARALRSRRAVAVAFARHGSGYVLAGYLAVLVGVVLLRRRRDRKSTRLNSSH